MRFSLILAAFKTLLFLPFASSTCSFTQTCRNAAMGDCDIPVKQVFEPMAFNYTQEFQCPEFNPAEGVCCNDDQNTLMFNSFSLLGFTFGSDASGCDICAINLRRFWCYFTCSPNQHVFVQAYDNIVVPNPFDATKNVTVLNVTYSINPNTACQMYQSCKKTPYVSQVSAMNSAEGLLNFLGSNAVATGSEKITMIYSNENSVNITLHSCNETFQSTDQYGYPIKKNCSCNNCDLSCTSTNLDSILKPMDIKEGFNTTLIVAFYCAIVAETVICILARRYIKTDRKRKESRGHSMERNDDNTAKDPLKSN